MTEKKQQHKKKRGKVQHIRGSPKKRKISGKAFFSSESIPGKILADVKNQITDKASELKRADQKKLFLANFPYLMFAYFFNKIAWLYRVNTGATSWDKFMNTITYFELAFRNLWPSLNHMDLFWGIAGGVVVKFVIIYRTKNARNKNILVIGGSGSGKTRFFVKPNIMQMHSSYVITDPKGTVLLEVGSMLAKGSPMTDENGKIVRDKEGKVIYEPYKIKVLNTINFKKSMHYNPFVYIRSEKDILKLVTTIIANTKGEGQQSGEDFGVKAEKLYYCALIGYIWYEGREEEKNFNTLLEMINVSEAREDDENFKNPVDLMFDELEQKDPNHFAVRQYKKYKLAAGKTAKSILISCGARLAPFDIAELRELMSYDELELDLVGDRKTALFVIISDTDDTFNFIVSIMYTQLFNLLCDRADDVYGGRLPIHVRCLLDEFANIGQIPKFEKLIATIRSREISASIILQSKSQLKAIYKDNADTIEGNCDTTLFLGGKEKTTLKEIAEILGKETIDLYNTSDTRGSQRSYGMNYQKTGKELMSQDEIAVMDGGKCILQVRGVRPFFSNKYDICKHKNYKYLSDYDKKNTFDIEKYLSTNLILKPEDEVELYQM